MHLFRRPIQWLLLAGLVLILSLIVDNVLADGNIQDISFYDALIRRIRSTKGKLSPSKNSKSSKVKVAGETPKQRPWGTEVKNWQHGDKYTLHLDKGGRDRTMQSNNKLNLEVDQILDKMVDSYPKGKKMHFDGNGNNRGTMLMSGKSQDKGVRLDLQKVDGKVGERQYGNYQIQKNGPRLQGKPSTLAEFHLEAGKSFEPSAVRDAVKLGMKERDAVWLSAKEQTFDPFNNKKKNWA